MKNILITAYAVNPYKGSEDAMGWNMLMQAARFNNVIAVTRKNNQSSIENYMAEHPKMDVQFRNIRFLYFDWPLWMIQWKKGPLLSMVYYYCWQLSLALWIKRKKLEIDVVHNLNFHNDWTPTFLWILGKPLVWGHVGHHPKIPREFILPVFGKKEYLKDRLLWCLKKIFWNLDPFLYISKKKAATIICLNSEAVKKLRLKKNYIIHPSVAAEEAEAKNGSMEIFRVLSVGRFVPLKGFDLTIRSFAQFYKSLAPVQQQKVKLTLVGSGPQKKLLQQLCIDEQIEVATEIIEWIPREKVADLYRSSTVFLFPSHEGAGMVVPEAMSHGLPVICLKNCGPGELIHPDSSGAVSYESYVETVRGLANQLHKLYQTPQVLKNEKLLSKERHQKLFVWDVRGEMLNQIYNDVCPVI